MNEASTAPGTIFGVDFSGAADAGRKTWIAAGVVEDDRLHIERCAPAPAWFRVGPGREECHRELVELIAGEEDSVFGIDFPFALPRSLVTEATWEAFVLGFGARHETVEGFDDACRTAAEGRELRRATEREAGPTLSPYNRRLRYQTYYGIRDVLGPLVRRDAASVVPMRPAASRRASVLEVYPRGTLRLLGLYESYKGRTEAHRQARERIFAGLEGEYVYIHPWLWPTLVENAGGDALDCIVAAFAVFSAVRAPGWPALPGGFDPLEGHVYV